MPWVAGDAEAHTKRANTPQLQELWAKVANERLAAGDSDAEAIRKANAVIARRRGHMGRHTWL